MGLVADPVLAKDAAFGEAGRDAFGPRGLLPPAVETIEQQVARDHEGSRKREFDLKKRISRRDVHDRNRTLDHAPLQAPSSR